MREPYEPKAAARARARAREELPDDELADEEAIELSRREQQHEPADLIGAPRKPLR